MCIFINAPGNNATPPLYNIFILKKLINHQELPLVQIFTETLFNSCSVAHLMVWSS